MLIAEKFGEVSLGNSLNIKEACLNLVSTI